MAFIPDTKQGYKGPTEGGGGGGRGLQNLHFSENIKKLLEKGVFSPTLLVAPRSLLD